MSLHDVYFDAAKSLSQTGTGTQVSHEMMATLVGASVGSGAYYSRVAEVKEVLRSQYHMFLDTVRKQGYVIVSPGNEILQCEKEFIGGYRRMETGAKRAVDIDMDLIKDAPMRARTIERAQQMSAIIGMIRHGLSLGQSKMIAL